MLPRVDITKAIGKKCRELNPKIQFLILGYDILSEIIRNLLNDGTYSCKNQPRVDKSFQKELLSTQKLCT